MNKITRNSKFESFQLAYLFQEGNLRSAGAPFYLHSALKGRSFFLKGSFFFKRKKFLSSSTFLLFLNSKKCRRCDPK